MNFLACPVLQNSDHLSKTLFSVFKIGGTVRKENENSKDVSCMSVCTYLGLGGGKCDTFP